MVLTPAAQKVSSAALPASFAVTVTSLRRDRLLILCLAFSRSVLTVLAETSNTAIRAENHQLPPPGLNRRPNQSYGSYPAFLRHAGRP